MGMFKKRKILQIFHNGCLNSCLGSFSPSKETQLFFYEKDLKNFHIYSKNKVKRLTLNDTQNLLYRKKYVHSKN